jgi:hypothetical protein
MEDPGQSRQQWIKLISARLQIVSLIATKILIGKDVKNKTILSNFLKIL